MTTLYGEPVFDPNVNIAIKNSCKNHTLYYGAGPYSDIHIKTFAALEQFDENSNFNNTISYSNNFNTASYTSNVDDFRYAFADIGKTFGKYYWEATIEGRYVGVGLTDSNWKDNLRDLYAYGSILYYPSGQITSTGESVVDADNNPVYFDIGDKIGIGTDLDNQTVTFYVNNIQLSTHQLINSDGNIDTNTIWFPTLLLQCTLDDNLVPAEMSTPTCTVNFTNKITNVNGYSLGWTEEDDEIPYGKYIYNSIDFLNKSPTLLLDSYGVIATSSNINGGIAVYGNDNVSYKQYFTVKIINGAWGIGFSKKTWIKNAINNDCILFTNDGIIHSDTNINTGITFSNNDVITVYINFNLKKLGFMVNGTNVGHISIETTDWYPCIYHADNIIGQIVCNFNKDLMYNINGYSIFSPWETLPPIEYTETTIMPSERKCPNVLISPQDMYLVKNNIPTFEVISKKDSFSKNVTNCYTTTINVIKNIINKNAIFNKTADHVKSNFKYKSNIVKKLNINKHDTFTNLSNKYINNKNTSNSQIFINYIRKYDQELYHNAEKSNPTYLTSIPYNSYFLNNSIHILNNIDICEYINPLHSSQSINVIIYNKINKNIQIDLTSVNSFISYLISSNDFKCSKYSSINLSPTTNISIYNNPSLTHIISTIYNKNIQNKIMITNNINQKYNINSIYIIQQLYLKYNNQIKNIINNNTNHNIRSISNYKDVHYNVYNKCQNSINYNIKSEFNHNNIKININNPIKISRIIDKLSPSNYKSFKGYMSLLDFNLSFYNYNYGSRLHVLNHIDDISETFCINYLTSINNIITIYEKSLKNITNLRKIEKYNTSIKNNNLMIFSIITHSYNNHEIFKSIHLSLNPIKILISAIKYYNYDKLTNDVNYADKFNYLIDNVTPNLISHYTHKYLSNYNTISETQIIKGGSFTIEMSVFHSHSPILENIVNNYYESYNRLKLFNSPPTISIQSHCIDVINTVAISNKMQQQNLNNFNYNFIKYFINDKIFEYPAIMKRGHNPIYIDYEQQISLYGKYIGRYGNSIYDSKKSRNSFNISQNFINNIKIQQTNSVITIEPNYIDFIDIFVTPTVPPGYSDPNPPQKIGQMLVKNFDTYKDLFQHYIYTDSESKKCYIEYCKVNDDYCLLTTINNFAKINITGINSHFNLLLKDDNDIYNITNTTLYGEVSNGFIINGIKNDLTVNLSSDNIDYFKLTNDQGNLILIDSLTSVELKLRTEIIYGVPVSRSRCTKKYKITLNIFAWGRIGGG